MSSRGAMPLVLLLAATPWPSFEGLAARLTETEKTEVFSRAKDYFREANEVVGNDPQRAMGLYRQAVVRFERLVRDGEVHNGRLFYNIGNTYFRMEDLGRAILNYRRAEPLIPNDVNLQQNLGYARAERLDKIEVKEKTKVLHTLFFWHYDIPEQTRSFVFLASFLAAWLLAGVRLYVRRAPLGWALAVAICVSVLFLASLAVQTGARQRVRPGVIVSPEVVARKGDSEAYHPSFTEPLHAGTEFVVEEDRGEWCQVQLADGRRCWLPAASVEYVR